MELSQLLWLIPPALIVSGIYFVIKLFGEMISDYVAYADDRQYGSKLFGIMFFISHIVYPLLFSVLTYLILSTYVASLKWSALISIVCISSLYSIKFHFESLEFFDRQNEKNALDLVFTVLDFFIHDWGKRVKKVFFSPLNYWSKFYLYLVFTLLIFSFKSGNYILFAFSSFFALVCLVLSVSVYAMESNKMPDVIVFFNNTKISCKLMKVGSDFVKCKEGNKIMLLDKKQVSKIEFK